MIGKLKVQFRSMKFCMAFDNMSDIHEKVQGKKPQNISECNVEKKIWSSDDQSVILTRIIKLPLHASLKTVGYRT